jgi:hypothetical protein
LLESRNLLAVAPLPLGAWSPFGPTAISAPDNLLGSSHGRVAIVAADPSNANVVYLGGDRGGIWKTTDWLDKNPHWTPLTDGQSSPVLGLYNSLVVCPSNPNVLYATVQGPGPGGGILHSSDGGGSWEVLNDGGNFDIANLYSLAVDPNHCNTLYVAVVSSAGGGGVYKSTLGGVDGSWVNTTAAFHNGPVTDLVMDPTNPLILYAGFTPADINHPDATNGIWKTTTGGATLSTGAAWSPVANQPVSSAYVGNAIRLAIAPSDDHTLYTTVFTKTLGLGDFGDGIPIRYASTSSGTSWTVLEATSGGYEERLWHILLTVDPNNSQHVFVNDAYQLWQSTNGGQGWTSGAPFGEDFVGLTYDAQGNWVTFGDHGVFFSSDQGQHWSDKSGDLNITEFYDIAIAPPDAQVPSYYGVAQDQFSYLRAPASSAGTWDYTSQGNEAGKVLIDPQNPSRLYGYNPLDLANIVLRSDDHGNLWTPIVSGIKTKSFTDEDYPFAYATQHSFLIDPSNSSRLLLGTNQVYEMTPNSDGWRAISGVLSSSTTEKDQYITALAGVGNIVYAATADGQLFVTFTDGATWFDAGKQLPALPSNIVVSLQVDPANPLRVFAVTSDMDGTRLWESIDGGVVSWSEISGPLPAGVQANTLAVDWRYARPVLYLGTQRGVYASLDDQNLSLASAGLPVADVQDLQLDPSRDLLIAATYGRGAWSAQATGPLAALSLSLPTQIFAPNKPFDVTVRAVDSAGRSVASYTGTVGFTSSDPTATLPASYTFTAADQGVHTFSGLILRTPGTQFITAQDQGNSQLSSTQSVFMKGLFNVTPAVGIKNGFVHWDPSRFRLQQKLTLVYNGKQPVYGPLFLVLDGLPRRVKLRKASGVTRALAPMGSPYVRIDLPRLDPGQKITVTLDFRGVTKRKLRFVARLLEGEGDL